MPPRPASSDRRWERTRRALLDGGRRVIADKGVGAASIAEIVAEAGVSQPSFYNHFEDKEDLLHAIVRDFFEAEGAKKREVLSTVEDPAEALAIAAKRSLAVAALDPVVAWVFVRASGTRDLLRPPDVDPLAAAIERGMCSGRFNEADPNTVALMIRGASFPVLRRLLEGRAPADMAEQFAVLVLQMLGLSQCEAQEIARRPLPEDASAPRPLPGKE